MPRGVSAKLLYDTGQVYFHILFRNGIVHCYGKRDDTRAGNCTVAAYTLVLVAILFPF